MTAMIRRNEREWHPAGIALAIAVVIEIATAVAVIASGAAHGGVAMLLAGTLSFASIILLIVAPIPIGARVALTVAVMTTLLALSLTLDPMGVRQTDRAVSALIGAQGAPTPPTPDAVAPIDTVPLTVRMTGSIDDPDFTAMLRSELAAALRGRGVGHGDIPAITATVAIDPVTDDPTARRYRINVSIGPAGRRSWCGQMTIKSPARDAVAKAVALWIAASIDGDSTGSGGCA